MKGAIPNDFKLEIFSFWVVDPFTLWPSSMSFFAKGNPSQPQPKTPIFLTFSSFMRKTKIAKGLINKGVYFFLRTLNGNQNK